MARYYRRTEGGLSRLAIAGGLLVLFVVILLVGKWAVGGERFAAGEPDPGDLGGEPTLIEGPAGPPGGQASPDPAGGPPDDIVAAIHPPGEPTVRWRSATPPPADSGTLLATALAEALGAESAEQQPLFDTSASPAPERAPEPDSDQPEADANDAADASPTDTPKSADTTSPQEPRRGEPGFEGRIGRRAVLAPPPEAEPPSPPATKAPKPKPKPKPKQATRPSPPPTDEPEDAGEPPDTLALFAPSPPKAGPDPRVRRSRRTRRRGRRRPRARRTVATLQADKLTSAAAAGMVSLVQQLIDLGTPVDGKDAEGQTALQAAVDAGQDDVVTVLLGRGADPDHLDPSQRRLAVTRN